MAETDIERKMKAMAVQPRLTAMVLSEAEDRVLLQAGGCVVEINRRHIAEWIPRGDQVEVTLTQDALVLVSTAVSVQKGFVTADVYTALNQLIAEDACNCNCNCNCTGNSSQCNCNCNCDLRRESPAVPPVTHLFRKSFTTRADQVFTG
jgi:hypothetical protein